MNDLEEKLSKFRDSIKPGLDRLRKDDQLHRSYVNDVIVPSFRDVLESLFSPIESLHLLDSKDEDGREFVIHYTGVANLISMLQGAIENNGSSSLRLYDSVHLNDPDEGNYFDRYLKHSKNHDLLPKSKAHHAYIVSFILPQDEKDMSNNLVFWRAYGKEGKGCSLTVPIRRNRLRRVHYGEKKVGCSDLLLIKALETLKPLMGSSDAAMGQLKETLINTIEGYIEQFRYLFKSDAYDYEKECRLVVPESDTKPELIRFEYVEEGSDVRIRHFYENKDLDIRNLLVTGSVITLGPRVSYPHNVKYYLETLLGKINLSGPDIRISKIPYRVFEPVDL